MLPNYLQISQHDIERGNHFINQTTYNQSYLNGTKPPSFANIHPLPSQNIHSTGIFNNTYSTSEVNNFNKYPPLTRNHTPTKTIYNNAPFSTSQVIYKTQPIPLQFQKPVNQNPKLLQQNFIRQRSSSIIAPTVKFVHPNNQLVTVRPMVLNSNIENFKRDVSPLSQTTVNNVKHRQLHHQIPNYANDDLQKYQALRWQNKYEDLKVKYYQLLNIIQKSEKVEDTWIIQQENKLLRQKVKILQERDQVCFQQVSKRIEKIIHFHKDTTTKQCELLVDRFRLENKFLQKL